MDQQSILKNGEWSEEWGTPRKLFKELDYEFHFDLDACASEKNRKCKAYFSREINALKHSWTSFKSVFMNPPYGKDIGRWLRKAYMTSLHGTTVVCLVPAKTDTIWWHNFCMKGEVRFIRGRLKFQGAKRSAPFASAIVIFRGKK